MEQNISKNGKKWGLNNAIIHNIIPDILPSNNKINPHFSSFFGISYGVNVFVPSYKRIIQKKR